MEEAPDLGQTQAMLVAQLVQNRFRGQDGVKKIRTAVLRSFPSTKNSLFSTDHVTVFIHLGQHARLFAMRKCSMRFLYAVHGFYDGKYQNNPAPLEIPWRLSRKNGRRREYSKQYSN